MGHRLLAPLVSMENQQHGFFWSGDIETAFVGHIFAEVFKDRIYQPYLPLNRAGTLALDIGAHLGIVSLYLAKYFERVIALEPSSEHFANLLKMVEFNGLTNVAPVKKALFIENGRFGFGGPKDNNTMRSLHMATWAEGKPEEEVETTTLESLFKEFNIEHVNLLKLDIEGSEHEVLSHPSFKKVADKIDTIVVERHQWSGRHPNQLNEALKNAGFIVEQIPNQADLLVAKRR